MGLADLWPHGSQYSDAEAIGYQRRQFPKSRVFGNWALFPKTPFYVHLELRGSEASILLGMVKMLVCLALGAWWLSAKRQHQPSINGSERVAVIADVKPSVYPQLAFAAHVSGIVELDLAVRRDGTLQSAEVASGPSMLRQAALGVVQQARFECQGCGESSTQIRVAVRYTLGEAMACSETEESSVATFAKDPYLQVTHSSDTITITDRPIGTCDYAATISKNPTRSIKCLFLWKCGWR